jgi:hypothetical protein
MPGTYGADGDLYGARGGTYGDLSMWREFEGGLTAVSVDDDSTVATGVDEGSGP